MKLMDPPPVTPPGCQTQTNEGLVVGIPGLPKKCDFPDFLIFLGGGVYSKYEKIWRVAKTLRSKWVNNLLIFMEGIVFLTFTIHSRQKSKWWQPKYFLFSSLPGEMIQFDDHIFQRGWFNHQQENPSTVAPGQRPSWATQVAQCCCVLCRRLCLLVRVFVTHRLRKSF